MNKKEKEIIVNNVLHSLKKCTALFIVNFEKINAFKVVELKKSLFKSNGQIVVVKNSLLSLAAKKNDSFRTIASSFQQQIALIYAFDDVFKTASVVNAFLKESTNIKFKAGLINDVELSDRLFERVSKINSQNDLRSQVCGMLKNPIINLIAVLTQISKK
jgi:ribosomal protein L10